MRQQYANCDWRDERRGYCRLLCDARYTRYAYYLGCGLWCIRRGDNRDRKLQLWHRTIPHRLECQWCGVGYRTMEHYIGIKPKRY